MALTAGTQLGPYEIVAPLGAGGMGEVYRARDTRLDRTVAVKILPTHLSADSAAKQRFDREARAISSLSHANICQLYDVGHQDGTDYIVMEFLEGETLAERIRRGPIPTDQLLKIGSDICDGLERAHKTGVIHRDLKPANIMLTKSGAKLMDFGLAKAVEAEEPPAGTLTQTVNVSPSAQPITQAGVVVGTFQYMSPEQVEGKPADARSDIFSLGGVLYEMATGKRAFDGKTSASVIAAILERDPAPISTLQTASPPALDRLVKSCLAKDPDERWQTAHDVKLQLQSLRDAGSQSGFSNDIALGIEAAQKARTRSNRNIALLVLGTLLGSGIVFSVLGYMVHTPKSAPLLHASVNLPPGVDLDTVNVAVALSPDATQIAFTANQPPQKDMIWVRSLDNQAARALPGTEDGSSPFWSPDSRAVGFFADGKLKRIDVSSGNIVTLCDAPAPRGGTWSTQGVILFAPTNTSGLSTVPESGGTPTLVTQPEAGVTDRVPYFLPDGVHAIFLRAKAVAFSQNQLMSLNLATREVQTIGDTDSEGQYVEPGYLIHETQGNLQAEPFNSRAMKITGPPRTILQDVTFNPARRAAQFAVSNSGVLIYLSDTGFPVSHLTWYDVATGAEIAKVGEPARFIAFSVSPDDRRAVAAVATSTSSSFDTEAALWMYDLERSTGSRFTFGSGSYRFPVWAADGQSVFYESTKPPRTILRKSANGDGEPIPVTYQGDFANISAASPDNQWLSISFQSPRFFRIELVPLVTGKQQTTFYAPDADARHLSFSADGKWAAYGSNETGRQELYVVPFPGPGGRWQITKDGMLSGGWTKQPNKLCFLGAEGKLYVVDVATNGNEIEVLKTTNVFGEKPVPLAKSAGTGLLGPSVEDAITRDGKRILLAPDVGSDNQTTFGLITNWRAAIEKP
jgi:eukaryotic-like serine/threonine-protein kinase